MINQEKNAMKMAMIIIKKAGDYGLYNSIQYKNGYCNITDGRILLRTNLIYDESHEGKLINPSTLRVFEETIKFPDIEKLMDTFDGHKYINESIKIPEFIFKLGSFKIHDFNILYLNENGFSIDKKSNTIAGIHMQYIAMLKYLEPMTPKIKAKNDSSAVIFEYGEPVHTTVIIMPVKI